MPSHAVASVPAVAELPGQSNRRDGSRTPTLFTLLYSGMDADQILMGDGVVTNLSASGIGVRGNRSVNPGMELALFVDLPGVEEPVCIGQSRVSWVEGDRFGVELGSLEVGGEESSAILLGESRHPLGPRERYLTS